jgi:hypothetical protein
MSMASASARRLTGSRLERRKGFKILNTENPPKIRMKRKLMRAMADADWIFERINRRAPNGFLAGRTVAKIIRLEEAA